MRVIGGTFGGRRLKAVEGHATRPTSDRVREALFSRLEARYDLAGAAILDVFSGTGALAIEALSRGAARATCIELERRALDTLRANVRGFDLSDQVRVVADDYRKVLARIAATPTATGRRRRFHGVFLDPPYGKGLAREALELLVELDLVRFGGWVTVEVGRREDLPETVAGSPSSLRRVREDNYGDTKLALYECHEAGAAAEGTGTEGPVEREAGSEGREAGSERREAGSERRAAGSEGRAAGERDRMSGAQGAHNQPAGEPEPPAAEVDR